MEKQIERTSEEQEKINVHLDAISALLEILEKHVGEESVISSQNIALVRVLEDKGIIKYSEFLESFKHVLQDEVEEIQVEE